MNDILRRNYARRRATTNRYVTDNDTYWREELHARIDDLQPLIVNACEDNILRKTTNNIWGFPVDEQSTANALDVLQAINEDYWHFVGGRRVWSYTETDGYWTEERISRTIAYAFVMALWDIGSQLLISYYPLVEDDLRLRTGKTHTGDNRETYHDSKNKLDTGNSKYTQHDNTRNKIHESTDGLGTETINSRDTTNSTTINDTFLSPQDQGVKPSKQSTNIMNHGGGFERPENHGVAEVEPNGDAKFTTATTNNFEGTTNTAAEGRTNTNRTGHSRVDERDYLEGNDTFTSGTEAENNVGAKVANDTYHERDEKLDISGVLQSFYDLFKDDLLMKIDNRMLPYYLNMKISRFRDNMTGRKEYL